MPLGAGEKRPLDAARLREQLGRLGETPFVLGALDISGLADGLFLPVSELNDLRQQAVTRTAVPPRCGRRRPAWRTGHWRSTSQSGDRLSPSAHDAATRDRTTVRSSPPRSSPSTTPAPPPRPAPTRSPSIPSCATPRRRPRASRALIDELAAAGMTLRLRTPTIVRPEERKTLDKWLALGHADRERAPRPGRRAGARRAATSWPTTR